MWIPETEKEKAIYSEYLSLCMEVLDDRIADSLLIDATREAFVIVRHRRKSSTCVSDMHFLPEAYSIVLGNLSKRPTLNILRWDPCYVISQILRAYIEKTKGGNHDR